MNTLVESIMTKTCARDLTDRIKTACVDMAEMLWRAYQGRAWVILGYASWKEYCEAEFQMSRRHAYRLLDFVEVKNVLCDQLVTPETESQTRPLAQVPKEKQVGAWGRAVEMANGEQPTAKQVEQAARQARNFGLSAEEIKQRQADEEERQYRITVTHQFETAFLFFDPRAKTPNEHASYLLKHIEGSLLSNSEYSQKDFSDAIAVFQLMAKAWK